MFHQSFPDPFEGKNRSATKPFVQNSFEDVKKNFRKSFCYPFEIQLHFKIVQSVGGGFGKSAFSVC